MDAVIRNYTPGPWYIQGLAEPHSVDIAVYSRTKVGNPDYVARVYGEGVLSHLVDERNANARLIALAPEMYEKLKTLVDDLDAGCSHCWGDEHPESDDDCSFCCSRKAVEALIARAEAKS